MSIHSHIKTILDKPIEVRSMEDLWLDSWCICMCMYIIHSGQLGSGGCAIVGTFFFVFTNEHGDFTDTR